MICWVRLPGVTLEHHLEKTLTFLAFFDGSSKHKEFLEARDPTDLDLVSRRIKKLGVKFQDRFWTEDVLCFFLRVFNSIRFWGFKYPNFYFTFLARCRHHQHIRFGDIANDIWGWVKTLVPSEPQNSW